MPHPPDESGSRWDWLALTVLAAALVAKVPTLGVPAFWDETAWLGQAGWLAEYGFRGAIPGLRPDAQFFGHPPGLHLAAAVAFRTVGPSIEVAHALIALLAAIGVCATYVLVRRESDVRTALLAATLLLLSPAWFSSAGQFLADLPVTALGVLSAVFVRRGRLLLFVVTASCMVMVKETAVSLVVALVAFRAFTRPPGTRGVIRDTLPWMAPLLVFIAFIAVQKAATGRFFYIFDYETESLFELSLTSVMDRAWQITRWLFVAQFRWVLTVAILVNLATSASARRRPDVVLLALVALASGYAFSVLYYSPRYVLPVLPFLCATGAISLMTLARTPLRQVTAAFVAAGLTLWSVASDPYRGHGENNMTYVRIARMHQEAAHDVATRYAGARILATWPVADELGKPLLGYVDTPLQVTWFKDTRDLDVADLVVVALPANPDAERLSMLVRSAGWRTTSAHQLGEHTVTVYERP